DHVICTGMGEARNAIIVASADVVIAVGGGLGTLSEIALALKLGKRVVALGSWELAKGGRPVEVPGTEREIPADGFFMGSFETALAPEELLVRMIFPRRARSGGAYHKLRRRVGDFATVGVAVDLALDEAGAIEHCGIGMSGVGLSYVRAAKAEEHLRGRPPEVPAPFGGVPDPTWTEAPEG
ncbi:MAG: hypothetical protein ACK44W_14710, partial [Planctomycetota bacterium]